MLPRLLSSGLRRSQVLLAGSEAQSLLLSEFSMLFLTDVRLVLSWVLASRRLFRLLLMFCRASLVCLMAVRTQPESELARGVTSKNPGDELRQLQRAMGQDAQEKPELLAAPLPRASPLHRLAFIKQELPTNSGTLWGTPQVPLSYQQSSFTHLRVNYIHTRAMNVKRTTIYQPEVGRWCVGCPDVVCI